MNKQIDAREVVDDLNQTWFNRFKEFEDMVENKNGQLMVSHEEALQKFDQEDQTKHLPKFEKFSVELIKLRKKENTLALNRNYVEAEKLKKKNDVMEKKELDDIDHKFFEDVRRRRSELEARHKKELNVFYQWVNEQRHDLLRKRDKDLGGPLKRLNYYNKLVLKVEKKGLAPNPQHGQSANRVTKKNLLKPSESQLPIQKNANPLQREKEKMFQ